MTQPLELTASIIHSLIPIEITPLIAEKALAMGANLGSRVIQGKKGVLLWMIFIFL
jgi:hypothetical protein